MPPSSRAATRAADHDLRDISGARIIHRARAGKRRVGAERADPAPAVAAGAGALEHLLAARVGAHRTDLVGRIRRSCQGRGQVGRYHRWHAAQVRHYRAHVLRRHLAQACIDRLAHGPRGAAVTGRVTVRQIREHVIVPGADAGAGVARDVVGTPAGGDRTGELAAVVQREGEVAGRVALPAMRQRLAQIGAAVPFGAARAIGLKALLGVEQCCPDAQRPALVKGERQRIGRRRGRTGARLNRYALIASASASVM